MSSQQTVPHPFLFEPVRNNNRLRACIYIRVSSEDQRKGYGLEFQLEHTKAAVERDGCTLKDEHIISDSKSGSTDDRPGWKEVLGLARRGEIDVVYFWKLDRMMRDEYYFYVNEKVLIDLGVELRFATQDLTDPFNKAIQVAVAADERRKIRERTYAGRMMSARKGNWINGGTPPFGYTYNRETQRLEIDEEEARVVTMMFRWLAHEKLSLYKIQCRLNEMKTPTKFDRLRRKKRSGTTCWWNKRTVGRILTNEVYAGTFTFRKYRWVSKVRKESNMRPKEDWITVTTPAIISREMFEKAREQLQKNSTDSPRRTKCLYVLGKLLICGYDGRRMQSATRHADKARECRYYFCSGRRKEHAARRCPSRSVSESRIVPPVWDTIRQLLSKPDYMLKRLAEFRDHKNRTSELSKKRSLLEIQQKQLLERRKRLVALYLDGAITKELFEKEHKDIKARLEFVEKENSKLQQLVITRDEMNARNGSLGVLYQKLQRKLRKASDEAKYQVLHEFVVGVTVWGEELGVELKLPYANSFAGQPTHGPSRKGTFTLCLDARLRPLTEVLREAQSRRYPEKQAA